MVVRWPNPEMWRHPFVVACVTALFGAVIAGLFTLKAAYVQAAASGTAKAKDETKAGLKQEAATATAAVPERSSHHRYRLDADGDTGTYTSEASFQEQPDYRVRMEVCTAFETSAHCVFTLVAKKTITVTNARNATLAYGTEGEPINACCLFFNDGKYGFHIFPDKVSPQYLVGRRTIAPDSSLTVSIRIPDYAKHGKLDSIRFSYGAGDGGVLFAIDKFLSGTEWIRSHYVPHSG